ncbi:MAG: helix-turn-helix domain-containing protein [Methanotrichaceae archaeon]|nr:helix-turn-helix domain-containing protein [Methanotrichaceae archaeon]
MDKVIRKPRIALSSEALQIIKIWATLEGKTADEKLSDLVISSAPQKVKDLVIIKPQRVDYPGGKISDISKGKKVNLQKNPEAQAEIMRLYKEGMTVMQIAERVGHSRSIIRDFLTKHNKQVECSDT